jgi:hypothetical protein
MFHYKKAGRLHLGFLPAQFKGQKMTYILSILILVFSSMMTIYHLFAGHVWLPLFIITIISAFMVFIAREDFNV